jgi:hypothetical protein
MTDPVAATVSRSRQIHLLDEMGLLETALAALAARRRTPRNTTRR